MKKLMLTGAALLLAACGSDSHDPAPTVPPPPLQPPDAFYTRLDGLVGNTPEDTEPVEVSELGKTEPEDTEPAGG